MTSLAICIAPRGCGGRLSEAATAAGAGGGTILCGEGTAPNSVLQLLGIGVSSREVLICAVPEECERAVMESFASVARGRRRFGVAFTTAAAGFFRFGRDLDKQDTTFEKGDENAMQPTENELVCFIVNKGYAEDAMAAARTAGAGGGTVLPARGTAKPGDETFLGVPLVPEKELLLVVVPSERAGEVCARVRALHCLSAPGSGVAFRVPVRSFATLGS